MNYPHWIVPYIGGSWVIGIIAIVHIYVSHFAVGGGAFLALGEHIAYKNNDEGLYNYLKSHTKFFVLLTTVFGAITGVGIWFVISLVSPDSTATLIQNFTLGWAVEYLFFVGELATAFAYYYTWDKLSKEKHLLLAKWYFAMSVCTLLVINGILTFMLTPGNWINSGNWLEGFFNATYFPSVVIRLIVMFAIAGLYSLLTACFIEDKKLKEKVVRFNTRWLIPLFLFGPATFIWFLYSIPQSTLGSAFTGLSSTPTGNFQIVAPALYTCVGASALIILITLFGPWRKPAELSLPVAIVLLVLGLITTGTGEWSRELLRKPYTVYGYMYSNGIRKKLVNDLNQNGFLASSVWAKGSLPNSATKGDKGEAIFRHQCMSCHTLSGYRSMRNLLMDRTGEDVEALLNLMRNTDRKKNPYLGYMPPVVGNDEDIDALAEYLITDVCAKKRKKSTVVDSPGKAVFKKAGCQGCHPGGGNVMDVTKPIKGSAFANKYPDDASLIQVLRLGQGSMPAFDEEQITDEQMKELVKYIRSMTD